jgi:hypothetical protein
MSTDEPPKNSSLLSVASHGKATNYKIEFRNPYSAKFNPARAQMVDHSLLHIFSPDLIAVQLVS